MNYYLLRDAILCFLYFLFYMQLSHLYIYYITIFYKLNVSHIKKFFFTLAGPGGAKRRFWGVILKF